MRLKALAVVLMVAFSTFTMFYWITDIGRRDVRTESDVEELLAYGKEVFLPDDTYTVVVDLSSAAFAPASLALHVNASIRFKNTTNAELRVTGTGSDAFELTVEADKSATYKIAHDGDMTVTAGGVAGSLAVSTTPPHLTPYGATCTRCHGEDGMGGPIPGDPNGRLAPNLHSPDLIMANKWLFTGGNLNDPTSNLNTYPAWVITLGGVVRSGDVHSPMPAWGQEYGGPLTRQQIEALTAMISIWLKESLKAGPQVVEDTVAAGQGVYNSVGCAGCHLPDLSGVVPVYPNIQTIGSQLVTDLPTPPTGITQMQADYDADKRTFLENWITDSWTNYNGGVTTGMPQFTSLSESQLRALITFLLAQQ